MNYTADTVSFRLALLSTDVPNSLHSGAYLLKNRGIRMPSCLLAGAPPKFDGPPLCLGSEI